MRGVAYALTASVVLMLGALTSASAGCYGDCTGYQDNRDRGYGYDRPAYREPAYDSGPRGHTVYYERGPEYQTGYYEERPAYRTSYYDGGYRGGYGGYEPYRRYSDYSYDRPYYSSGYGYGGGYGYGYGGYGYRGYGYGYARPCVGGGCSQTLAGYGLGGYGSGYGGYGYNRYSSGYGGYGGCTTAYIPYGWTWYRGTTC
jgi:hypothetical protein